MHFSKIKRMTPLFAVFLLCSCAQQPPTVIYNDLYHGSMEGTLLVASDDDPEPEAAFGTEIPDSAADITTVPGNSASGLTGTEPTSATTDTSEADTSASSFVTTGTSREPEPTLSPKPATNSSDVSPATETQVSTTAEISVPVSRATKYSFEYQKTNGALSILGPNLIYVGESFDYNYNYPGKPEDAYIIWNVDGDAGEIDRYGNFVADKRGVVSITVANETDGTCATLKVHCIEPGDDIDFLPLVNGIPIANKTYPLPKDYDPGFNNAALAAFRQLQAAANKEGLNIYIISSYRSYTYQKQVYAGWVNLYGSEADDISARPGYSEHQLGLAIDVNSCEFSFADTPEGKWLKEHCAEYGFILRYPSQAAKKHTGYSYEPWHIRYLGKQLAITVTNSGKTLEECLGIDSYYR